MAIKYVDSNASGANNGTSWTDAWALLETAWGTSGWTSGDVIYMASDHSQTQAGTLTFGATNSTQSDPFIVYSVDSADDSYTPATSANIDITGGTGDIVFQECFYAHGLFFQLQRNMVFDEGPHHLYFKDCNVKITGTTVDAGMTIGHGGVFRSCTFNSTQTAGGYLLNTCGGNVFEDCVFDGRGSTPFIEDLESINGMNSSKFVGCDFSGLTTSTSLANTRSAQFFNSRFVSGIIPARGTTGQAEVVQNYASDIDGSGTAKNYVREILRRAGDVIQDTAIYRDDGWQSEDGDTRLSHKLVPTSNMRGPHTPIHGPELSAYVGTTGSTTFTVYGVEDFATGPTLDEAWIVVSYLGTTNSVMRSRTGGRSIFSATGLTSDTKAWTGASGKTKFKMSETVTINKAGTYSVTVYLGYYESAKALWYCPLVEVS